MTEWALEALKSQPAIVLYTLLSMVAVAVAVWVSPIGSWMSDRYSESRQMQNIDLMRQYDEASADKRQTEIAGAMKTVLNGSLPRIEEKLSITNNQISQAVLDAAERDAEVNARLATGSEQMRSMSDRLEAHDSRLEELTRKVDGNTRKVERVDTILSVMKPK